MNTCNPLAGLVALGVVLVMACAAAGAGRDDSWRLPLDQKARIILHETTLKKHNILGLYPSQLDVAPDGTSDYTTAGYANVAHSICWTSNHLAGESYHYAFLKKIGAPKEELEAARKRVDELFEAVYRCQLVTGVRGLQARGYLIGHGPSYEERGGAGTSNDWCQGAGEYKDLRWRGDPSHHNYSDAIHGLGAYYDLAAEGPQKDRCREAIDALVSYWLDAGFKIYKLDRSRPPVPILGLTDGRTPNTRVMMVFGGLKVAEHATGNEKYATAYQKLVDQYGLRTRGDFPLNYERRDSSGKDDAEHVFGHLDNLFRMEKDPQLLRYYHIAADALWEKHQDDADSLFTYTYLAINPNSPDREKALADALHTLRTWPTDQTFKPRMNSLRPEIERAGPNLAKEPLPMNEAVWDNEYIWKGHLYQLDGWLSRIVTSVAVPSEDPVVIYATDGQDIYETHDGARTWRCLSDNFPTKPVRLACSSRVRFLLVVGADGFYRSATGGARWEKMPLPDDSGTPRDICADADNPLVLYAVTSKGVYRSRDFGEQRIGEVWDCVSAGLPSSARFAVAPGRPAVVYGVVDGTVYAKAPDEDHWQRGGTLLTGERLGPGIGLSEWLATDLQQPKNLYAAFNAVDEGAKPLAFVTASRDGGATWTLDGEKVYRSFAEGKLFDLLRSALRFPVNALVVDPRDSNVIYAAAGRQGLRVSRDGGRTWNAGNEGLDIPDVEAVIAPRGSAAVFAGTPAGLFMSDDQGRTWRDANLCLQFTRNIKRELGGADYLDAYWMGRYYGFIGDQVAKQRG